MIRKKSAQELIIAGPPKRALTGLEAVSAPTQPKIGTISFPVRGERLLEPIRDNTDLIVEIVNKRRPSLLLCAGWSVPTEQNLRMGNCGTVKSWREFLSSGGRVYVSASNWDVSNGQRPSDTLHSLWHNGRSAKPVYAFETDQVCYREWDMPLSA